MLSKKVLSWSLYDLANTAYSALIVTIFFPVFIKIFLGGNEFMIGLVVGSSLFLSALFVPFIGGISDATKVKKPFLISFTLLTIFATTLIAFSNLTYALIFGLLANLFYHVCLDIYDSFLPDITEPKHFGKVSGFGTAMGYVGTILSLIMAWSLLQKFGADTLEGTKLMFPATGIFFLTFALPIFFLLKDQPRNNVSMKEGVKTSLSEIHKTIMGIKNYKNIWLFLFASLLYVDSLNTSIVFLYLFGQEKLGMTIMEFFPIFGLIAFSAVLGSLFFGNMNDIVGPKRTLITALILWIVVILSLMIRTNFYTYLTAGMVGGTLLGAIWTATRPMLIKIAPKEKLTELFGFQGLTEKLGGAIGPIVYGFLVVKFDHVVALGSVLFFFTIGLILLFFVKEELIVDGEVVEQE